MVKENFMIQKETEFEKVDGYTVKCNQQQINELNIYTSSCNSMNFYKLDKIIYALNDQQQLSVFLVSLFFYNF
jgi:hypothetical protein